MLKTLNLSMEIYNIECNLIDDNGIIHIADLIEVNKSLQMINLSINRDNNR